MIAVPPVSSLRTRLVPFDVYQTLLRNIPVPTVDFVVKKENGSFLLIKRSEGAYSGNWFVIGGRILRGFEMNEALLKVASREIGLTEENILSIRFSHCQDVYNPEGENPEGKLPEWHNIWHFHVITVLDDFEPKLDNTSSDMKWFTTVPENVPDCVSKALKKAGLM